MANENVAGEEARPPTIEDLINLCKYLNEEGANYILIGGFSMIYHGFTRTTEDIDLLVDPTPDNIEKIKKSLCYLPDKASLEVMPDDVAKYSVVRIVDEFVIDLLKRACDVTFEDAIKTAEYADVRGVLIPVASLDTMIKTKQSTRERDKEDLKYLLQLKEEVGSEGKEQGK